MTTPKKPATPEVLDAELVPATKPPRDWTPNPPGGPGQYPAGKTGNKYGPYGKENLDATKKFRTDVRKLLEEKGLPSLERLYDAPDAVVSLQEKAAITLKLSEFAYAKPKPITEDVTDPTGQGGTQTRTMTVTFVTPKKE